MGVKRYENGLNKTVSILCAPDSPKFRHSLRVSYLGARYRTADDSISIPIIYRRDLMSKAPAEGVYSYKNYFHLISYPNEL